MSSDSHPSPPVSTALLRYALGLVYFHFGFLKFYPDLSTAEVLASQTILGLTERLMGAQQALFALAIFECAIGAGFLFHLFPRVTFCLFTVHMLGTFVPLFSLMEFTFKYFPFAPSMEGQYIMKNIVFLAAGWTVLYPDAFGKNAGSSRSEIAHLKTRQD